jgi:hypothetical protein
MFLFLEYLFFFVLLLNLYRCRLMLPLFAIENKKAGKEMVCHDWEPRKYIC